MPEDRLLLLPLWYAVFLLSLTCHEAAHALAAYRGGDPTAYHGGQVSLNPLPHMRRELVGTLVIPLLSFMQMGWMIGWASAPYDPLWEDRFPRRAAFMAVAGPLANLGLALIAFGALKAGLVAGWWVPGYMPGVSIEFDRLVVPVSGEGGALEGLGRLFSIMLSLNAVLFVFNLIPLPPMDGASIVAGLFEPARAARQWMRSNAMVSLIGLLAAWLFFSKLFWPIYRPVLRALFSL